jgi:hypothetical protein
VAAPQQQEVLTQDQESVLRAIDDLQVQFAATKLIIARNGDVLLDGAKAQPTGVNLVQQLFRESPPASDATHPRFVALMESLPTRYVRFFAETRYGNPFVVSVTQDGRTYLRKGLKNSGLVHQHGAGKVVVQVGRDAGPIIAGDVTIYSPEESDIAILESVGARGESPGDRAYRERAMLVSATGGNEQAVRIIARMRAGAARFDTDDVLALPKVAYPYLNVYTAGLPLVARSSEHAEFETARTGDGRHIVIVALQAGVVEVDVFCSWPTDPGVPWDWLIGELYTTFLFLNDARVRALYNATEPITVFPKFANLRGSRVSLQGIKHTLPSGSYARMPNVVVVPLAWREWELHAGEDPWPVAREFLQLALADSGAYGFERDVARMDGPHFETMYFELVAPSVRFWRPGQAPPQAI